MAKTSINIDIDPTQFAKVADKFDDLSTTLRRKIVRQGMRRAANAFLPRVKSDTPTTKQPVRRGRRKKNARPRRKKRFHLRDSLKVYAIRRTRKMIGVTVVSLPSASLPMYYGGFAHWKHRLGSRSLGNSRPVIIGKRWWEKSARKHSNLVGRVATGYIVKEVRTLWRRP